MTNLFLNTLMDSLKAPTLSKEMVKAYDDQTVNAITVVVNWTMSDAFDLTAEETIWLGWKLQEVLSPLRTEHAENIQAAVKQELDTFVYSAALFERSHEKGALHAQLADVKYASLDEWTKAITEIVFASYPDLRPMIAARIVGSISGLFYELGLRNDKKSRASIYLPTALRYIVAQR